MSPALSDNCIYYIRLRAEGIISTDDYILFFVPLRPISAPSLPFPPFFPLWVCEKREKRHDKKNIFNLLLKHRQVVIRKLLCCRKETSDLKTYFLIKASYNERKREISLFVFSIPLRLPTTLASDRSLFTIYFYKCIYLLLN